MDLATHARLRLEAAGHGGRPVPNTLFERKGWTGTLGIILPGRNYGPTMPLLYYPSLSLMRWGADLLRLEYDYAGRDLQRLPEAEKETRLREWMGADVAAVVEAALARRRYESVVMIGKSLGTVAMSLLLEGETVLSESAAVWLTPSLQSARVKETLLSCKNPSFLAIGTDDPHYDHGVIAQVRRNLKGKLLLIQGADHSLEVPGAVPRSLKVLTTILDALEAFLVEAGAARPRP